MKIFILLCCLAFPSLCNCQQGELMGSVFYKYNDFVGNRADAGSEVRLYKKGFNQVLKSTVDLKGTFTFSQLDTGTYIIFVKSEETNEDPYMSLKKLQICESTLMEYVGFNFKTVAPGLQQQAEKKFDEYTQYLLSKKSKPKKLAEIRSEVMDLVFKIYSAIPIESRLKLGITLPTDKLEIRSVTIESGKQTKVVVDFGNTYM